MEKYPSRSEKLEDKLKDLAEKGESATDLILYPAEIRKLKKQGFCISNIENFGGHLYTVHLDWSNPFIGPGIPAIVYSYIHGFIKTYPKKSVKNMAQKLYITVNKAK